MNERNFFDEMDAYVPKLMGLAKVAQLDGEKHSNHPIFKDLKRLDELRDRKRSVDGGLFLGKFPKNPQGIVDHVMNHMSAMASYGFNRMYWLADGYFEELVSDSDQRKFIESRLPKPEHYESVIAELSYWGWLKSRGLNPRLIEEDGLPDIYVGDDRFGGQVFCDVKALKPESSINRVSKIIKKANKQIKNANGEKTKGFCLIKLLSNQPYTDIDRFNECVETATRIMRSDSCRSVNFVILVKEDMKGEVRFPGGGGICLTRNSIRIYHSRARTNIKMLGDLEPKATVFLGWK